MENSRISGQELGVSQLVVPGCSKLNPRPNWAKALLFHVERFSILGNVSGGFHVEQRRAALRQILSLSKQVAPPGPARARPELTISAARAQSSLGRLNPRECFNETPTSTGSSNPGNGRIAA